MVKVTDMDLVHMCNTIEISCNSSGIASTVSFEIVGHRVLLKISLLVSLDSSLRVSKGIGGLFKLLREATASTLVPPWRLMNNSGDILACWLVYLVYKGTGSKEESKEVNRSIMLWYSGTADRWADARLRDSTYQEILVVGIKCITSIKPGS